MLTYLLITFIFITHVIDWSTISVCDTIKLLYATNFANQRD